MIVYGTDFFKNYCVCVYTHSVQLMKMAEGKLNRRR